MFNNKIFYNKISHDFGHNLFLYFGNIQTSGKRKLREQN